MRARLVSLKFFPLNYPYQNKKKKTKENTNSTENRPRGSALDTSPSLLTLSPPLTITQSRSHKRHRKNLPI